MECLAIALLAVVVTVPFADVLFTDARFYVRDLTRYYYPTKKILREIVRGGEFPYWNRYYGAGQPIASNPEYEVFYPLQWLILLPDYDLGYRLHILIHVYVAAFGMYVLLRSLRMRILAALFGAIAFAVGGLFVSYVNLLPILFAFVWMPWIGWLLMRAVERPSAARIAAAGMVVGLQALVGEPTTLVQTWGLSLLVAGWVGWRNGRWRGAGTGVAIATAVLAIGLSVGAVQLLPAAEHVGDSARSRPFSLGLATRWSMPPARLLELFAPNLFGHLFGERTYWGAGMYRDTSSPFIYSIYLGLPMVVFALAAFATRVRGRAAAIVVIIASTVLALGEHTPAYGLLHEIGVASSVRYPEKFLLPALICLVLLGSAGLDRFLRRDPVARRVSLRTAAAVAVVSGLMLILHLTPLSEALFRWIWGIADEARLATLLPIVRQDWALSLVRAISLCGILLVAFRVRGRVWGLLLVCFVTADLVPVGVGVLPRIDRSFFDEPPIGAELDPARGEYRIFHEVDWYGGGKVAKRYFATGDRAYQVIRNGMYPMTPATWGFRLALDRDYDKTALLPTVDFVGAMWQVRDAGQERWREIFAAMSNVRYRSRYRPFDEEMDRIGDETAAIRPVEFVEFDPSPRYYFADQIVRLRSREEFASRLALETFSPRVAFVESESFDPGTGVVLSVEETANSARLVVESDGPALLVASVTRHRYWSATVDGAIVGLEPVNVAYQGVRVGPGRHEVVMAYRNPKIVPLLVFSLLVLSGSLGVIVASLLRSRSRTISA
jgi:hypothetical protein